MKTETWVLYHRGLVWQAVRIPDTPYYDEVRAELARKGYVKLEEK